MLFDTYMNNCFNYNNLSFNIKLSAGLLASLYALCKGFMEAGKTRESLLANYMAAMTIKQIFLEVLNKSDSIVLVN